MQLTEVEKEFRGQSRYYGTWVYGYYVGKDIICKGYCYDDKGGIYLIGAEEVYPETVGQYTTLRDRNNKKIYVGDIVKVFITDKEYRIGVVLFGISDVGVSDPYYRPTGLGFYIYYVREGYTDILGNVDSGTEGKNIEVIGNIYDNIELLED